MAEMETVRNELATPPVVTTADEAINIFVARALHWGRVNRYDTVRGVLEEIGLGARSGATATYTINLGRLFQELGDTVEVTIADDEDLTDEDYLEEKLYPRLARFRKSLDTHEYTRALSQQVDVEAIIATYGDGSLGNVLATEGDEPSATWAKLVRDVLVVAERDDLCEVVENALTWMGFGAFLPPKEKVMNIVWRGMIFEGVTLGLDRLGDPHPGVAYDAIRRLLANERDEVTVA